MCIVSASYYRDPILPRNEELTVMSYQILLYYFRTSVYCVLCLSFFFALFLLLLRSCLNLSFFSFSQSLSSFCFMISSLNSWIARLFSPAWAVARIIVSQVRSFPITDRIFSRCISKEMHSNSECSASSSLRPHSPHILFWVAPIFVK